MLTKLDKRQRFHTNKLNKQKQIFSKKKKKKQKQKQLSKFVRWQPKRNLVWILS